MQPKPPLLLLDITLSAIGYHELLNLHQADHQPALLAVQSSTPIAFVSQPFFLGP